MDIDCPSGARCIADSSGARGCHDAFMMRCEHNTDCGTVLICAPDGVCREQCRTNRDCRDGTVCDRTMSPTLCVHPRDGGVGMDGGSGDGSIDTGVDAAIDTGAMGMMDVGIDVGIDAFASNDTGLDMNLPDAAVVTGRAPLPQLVGGGLSTCAVMSGGLRCWGDDASGQLGIGSTLPRHVSTPVPTLGASALTLASGNAFACATTASAVYCWGENALGQVGIGNVVTPQQTPVMISASSATTIASGRDHTCLLRGGAVQCWGDNSYGQLGDGTTNPHRAPTPTLALARPAIDLGAGGRETCALLDDGRVQCWGENNNGELGTGTASAGPNGTPQLVPTINDAVEVVVGSANACARRVNGAVVCWGDNAFKELGDGSAPTMRAMPGPVPTLPTAVELAAGLSHICARTMDGRVFCWGDNTFGQVGISFITGMQPTPVAVVGIAGATELAAGEYHTCARVSSGLSCWGANGSGQLGNGTTSGLGSFTPQTVM